MGVKKSIKKQMKKEDDLMKMQEERFSFLVNYFTTGYQELVCQLLFKNAKEQREDIVFYWSGLLVPNEEGDVLSWEEFVELWNAFDILHNYRLTKADYDKATGVKKKGKISEVIDYARLTFILSVLGFLGSVGFYFGVLREVYSPARDKQEIRVLKAQNEELQNTVNLLVEEVAFSGEVNK